MKLTKSDTDNHTTSIIMEETDPALHSSEPSNVDCDVCIGRKRKAEQACLECVASYCDIHLDLHNTLHVGKRHRLVEANENLQEKICPDHDKLLEVYCRTDQQCICHLCITDKHRGHDVIKMEKEVTDKQIQLGELQRRTTDITEAKEKDVQEIRQAVEAFKTSAQNALETNERNFTELIQSIKDNQSKVTELIQGQAEAAVRQADGFIETLNQGISNLRNIDAELQNLELLSHTNNDVQFLESAMPMPSLNEYKKPFVLLEHPYCSFEHATKAVSELKQKLNITTQWSLLTIAGRVKNTGIVTSPPPQTREEFLQYASKLTFNTNTAHESLCLSKEDSQVTATHLPQDYPDHSKRFDCRSQILCNEALSGSPQYWEVEFGGGCWVCIAVSYQGIRRKGKWGPLFGRNPYSWGLRCKWASFEFWHNNKQTEVKYKTHCSTVGVYLDHSAGILAFYNASNMSLIYKAKMQFTEPVYPGFGLAGTGSHVRLCDQAEQVSETSSPASIFDSSDSSS